MEKEEYQAKDILALTGLSYRQLNYWISSGLFEPNRVIQNGDRTVRIFSLEDVIVLRVAIKLLDFGIGFSIVRQVTAWLQNAFKEGRDGEYLFVAQGDELILLADEPDKIAQLLKGKCCITLDIAEIKKQLVEDIGALVVQKNQKPKKRGYKIPEFASA